MGRKEHKSPKSPLPSFSSEALLQQAVAGLLARLPSISGVQILQGAQEVGKDIVFKSKGPLGEDLPCACVVKNTQITGEVGVDRGARTVLQQVQQALDTPYLDHSGQEIAVQRVYVICPFNLGASTMNSIRGAFQQNAGRIVFIAGHELFCLFRDYWPDFFADEANALERYLTAASQEISADQPLEVVGTMYDLGQSTVSLSKVYVPQTFFCNVVEYADRPGFRELIPEKGAFRESWTVKDLRQSIAALRRLRQALSRLQAWGYMNAEKNSKGEDGVLPLIVLLETELEESFLLAVAHKYGRPRFDRKDLWRIEVSARFELTSSSLLGKRLDRVIETLAEELIFFNNLLAIQTRFVTYLSNTSEHTLNATPLLANEEFVKVRILDDCIRSGLAQYFTPAHDVPIFFPITLLDVWSGHLLITGTAGSGKTSFCRWNVLLDAERYRTGNSKIVPIYVSLTRLVRKRVDTLQDVVQYAAKESGLIGDLLQGVLEDKELTVRLYLDGLDEIPEDAQRERLIKVIHSALSEKPQCQVVATSRDTVYGPWLSWLTRVWLSELNHDQLRILSLRWLDNNEIQVASFFRQLDLVPSLNEVVRNPLLATLTLLVFRRTRHIPENKSRLYSIFTDLLAGGWDMAKGVLRQSHYGRDVKLQFLSGLAAAVHEKRQREFTYRDIKFSARKTFADTSRVDFNSLVHELLMDGLITRSGSSFQFSHLSFQEFLAAKSFLGSPKSTSISHAVRAVLLGDGWWAGVVDFYISLSGNPKELLSWLAEVASRAGIQESDANRQNLVRTVINSYPESFAQ